MLNESVSIVTVCSSNEDREWLALWLESLRLTCPENELDVLVVDTRRDRSLPVSLSSPAREYTLGTGGWCRAIETGVRLVLSRDELPGFLVFSHCDVVGVKIGWLDYAIEALISDDAGMVCFDPQDYVVGPDGSVKAYPGDWCVVVRTDAWLQVGGAFPPAIDSYCGIAWLASRFSSLGLSIKRVGTNLGQLVAHAAKERSRSGGRRKAPSAAAEAASLIELISSQTGDDS